MLVWLLGAGTPLRADEPATLDALQSWLDATRRLDARFVQTPLSGVLGPGEPEQGRVRIERPGRMRWDYESPERKVALVNGRDTALYLAEDAQMIFGQLDPGDDLLTTLLAGTRPLEQLFRVAPAALGQEPAGVRSLRLEPRRDDGPVQFVELTVGADAALLGARVQDAGGNVLDYRFTIETRNGGFEGDPFSFKPPPGTEIVGRDPAEVLDSP